MLKFIKKDGQPVMKENSETGDIEFIDKEFKESFEKKEKELKESKEKEEE